MKKSTIWLFGMLIWSCGSGDPTFTPEPIRNLSFGFETTLEDWVALGGGGERNADDDIVISSDTSSEGSNAVKFTVSTESVVAGGTRAELTFDQHAVEGDDTWYEYSFYLPADYQDVALNDQNGLVNWQILGQWHQQPVLEDGEDWDSYTGDGQSPPIALYYNYFSTADADYRAFQTDPEALAIHGFDPTWDEVSTISVVYGSQTIAIAKIEKDEWIRLRLNIKWSEKTDGYIQVWKNETEMTDGRISGTNMLNRASHYFKFGLYRNPTIIPTNLVYFDDIKVWYE